MHISKLITSGVLAAALWTPSVALACGGFFCSQSPVDQASERIIFAINDDGTTDMIVQIAYQGNSQDFAWVLPLAQVPDPDKLDTFPELAMMALDTGTGPTFRMHPDCQNYSFEDGANGGSAGSSSADAGAAPDGPVTVYIRETVGPYDVAVIGSDDAKAASDWLQTEGYRISGAMNEYVKLYTAEKMKLLALKLTDKADVSEIAPFRLRVPGDSPNIPLRLTSIAALPEMGIVTWIFANQRYEPMQPGVEVEIDNSKLRWEGYGARNNWKALVARAADDHDGKAWVVEQAGSTKSLRSLISSQPLDPSDERFKAQEALTALIAGKAYMTRLYTRLSPEEMTYDPGFKRSVKGDVAALRELPYVKELCDTAYINERVSPCEFNPCGALGLCRSVDDDNGNKVASCACAPGLTARSVPAADGSYLSEVACIDQQLSFINPGDKDTAGTALPDPCAGFSCGGHGTCVAMNMTPTCECEQGYVAKVTQAASGAGGMKCVEPSEPIPASFYKGRLKPRDLPIGREVRIIEVKSGGGACSVPAVGLGVGRAWSLFGLAGLLLGGGLRRRRARRLAKA